MAEQSPDYKKLFLEEQRRREEEQRRREAAEQSQDRAEEKTRKTTLPEFLDAYHNHLHPGLTAQTDATLSTRGDSANATNKLQPQELVAIWDALMRSEFAPERHFTSLHTLKESGEATLRSVQFENHANTLSPERQLEGGIGSMTNTETRVAAYITEYKPPHKLPLGRIYESLEDMKLDDVVPCRETDTPRDHFRRLMATVITQAFSYMVKLGVAYGCVCTGEAFIFLRVLDDPRTAHYFLSIPKGDVGGATGWAPDSDGANRLHLTAVGQMLAFTLQALKTPPRSHKWPVKAASQLNSWEVVYEDLLDAIPVEDPPSSEYRPPRHDEFLRISSCARPQDQNAASDEESDFDTPSRQLPSSQRLSRPHATTSNSSPSQSSRKGQGGQYCTQNCLLGLVNGGPLDMSCPNVRDHGQSHHQIDRPAFPTRIRQQLSDDLDTDRKPVSLPGACGVLFRVRLKLYGYTVAAKCTPIDFVYCLQHEAAVYDPFRPIRGIRVPVHLGNIDLATPYYYEGICELVHVMFFSFGGKRISQCLTTGNRSLITKQIDYPTRTIHNLGVLHNDLESRNILWNEETGRVMVVDFEISGGGLLAADA
ncbi:hypothetical protein GQ44DRAFT_752488 [Phaeosphaeriaceae sp. PMI808]|nr:hypothetical protein GQ44DRAFT_752488 [Phaeosphaeriaceae sp. PMI808]